MTDHTEKATTTEPMPWIIAVKLRCMELGNEAAQRRSMGQFELEADRRLRWVLGRERYEKWVGKWDEAGKEAERPAA